MPRKSNVIKAECLRYNCLLLEEQKVERCSGVHMYSEGMHEETMLIY